MSAKSGDADQKRSGHLELSEMPEVSAGGAVERDIHGAVEAMLAASDKGGRDAMRYLRVYLKNAIQFPNHPRYSTINPRNPEFHRRIGRVPGALRLLRICGFREDAASGNLVMNQNDGAGNITESIRMLCDALQELEQVIAAAAPANLEITVHSVRIDPRKLPTAARHYYLRLHCVMVGVPAADCTEEHVTEVRVARERRWGDRFTLRTELGACCQITLCEWKRLMPDRPCGFGQVSFGGGRDEALHQWVELTASSGHRGPVVASVLMEVDSEALKMWRAEKQDRARERQAHADFKRVLEREGRMPEAPDLQAAGVAEEGYVAPEPAHRSQPTAEADVPAAILLHRPTVKAGPEAPAVLQPSPQTAPAEAPPAAHCDPATALPEPTAPGPAPAGAEAPATPPPAPGNKGSTRGAPKGSTLTGGAAPTARRTAPSPVSPAVLGEAVRVPLAERVTLTGEHEPDPGAHPRAPGDVAAEAEAVDLTAVN
eukprot:TRINITY_DN26074_c0_g1_i1.p2 TRINITY_DN26074_c0_g1~~TRINITY_DN26074_c0_g1_i1.p2  ORF type:complete len:486 (+),score=138.15 TRINITY_DN26074_c0_g1_i1:99-1556(+)